MLLLEELFLSLLFSPPSMCGRLFFFKVFEIVEFELYSVRVIRNKLFIFTQVTKADKTISTEHKFLSNM